MFNSNFIFFMQDLLHVPHFPPSSLPSPLILRSRKIIALWTNHSTVPVFYSERAVACAVLSGTYLRLAIQNPLTSDETVHTVYTNDVSIPTSAQVGNEEEERVAVDCRSRPKKPEAGKCVAPTTCYPLSALSLAQMIILSPPCGSPP